MSCREENKRLSNIRKMRELAVKAANMEQTIYVLVEKPDGIIQIAKENEQRNGVIKEYIFPVKMSF